ncbi:MAG TPA: hypothetical protein VFX97_07280 [Pyrinomonadaceae bacterium]|nr:hypothetical protein [Pyrinomonadaceae bacterium]
MISDSPFTKSLGKRFLRQLKLEDVIFAPYLLVVTWQFFCGLPNRYIGWTLAAVAALAVWCAYVLIKSPDDESPSRAFWIVVFVPLVSIYLLRALYPDISFDVLNYHIFQTEHALRGPLVEPSDFFPTPAFFNPAPDLLTGFYRYLLGYRLGTISNLAAVVWLGIILDRMLLQFVRGRWWRAVAILLIVCTEQIFFQLNNYMIDLLALPLLLEATRQALQRVEPAWLVRRSLVISLFLGISVTFKLANLVFAIPIALVFAINIAAAYRGLTVTTVAKVLAVFGAVFLAPLVPFSVLVYRLTGNAFFPFYNAIFKSPYWPNTNVFDPRWGPQGLLETLSWPIVVFFKPERFCELPVYSGRMSLGVIAALICLVVARKDGAVRALCFITLLGALLWSAASGYSRYAIFVEITTGIIIVRLVHDLWMALAKSARPLRWLTAGAVCALLLAQVGLAFAYGNQYEWSMRAPLTARSIRDTVTETRELLRDRDLRTYLSADDQFALNDVDGWIETTYKTTAFMALLKPDIPTLGARTQEYFVTRSGREKFDQTISAAQGKRLFTLTEAAHLQSAREVLAKRGLATGSVRPFSIPYFSRRTTFDMLLVEVIPASRETSNAGDSAPRGLPLADSAFNARIRVPQVPLTLQAGTKYVLEVSLENASNIRWPGQQPTWQYQITVGNRWFTEDGQKVTDVDGRVALADDLPPATSATLRLTITAPATPGEYVLELDVIQEGVAWFSDRGSTTFRAKVTVN